MNEDRDKLKSFFESEHGKMVMRLLRMSFARGYKLGVRVQGACPDIRLTDEELEHVACEASFLFEKRAFDLARSLNTEHKTRVQ